MKMHKIATCLFVIGALIILPNCDWFKGKEAPKQEAKSPKKAEPKKTVAKEGNVLVTIAGEPKFTVEDLEAYKTDIIEAQPEEQRAQYKMIMEVMPGAAKNLLDTMINEVVLNMWAEKNQIDQKAEYKKDLEKGLRFLKSNLSLKFFQEAYPTKINASDIKKYYDENKDKVPQLKMSAGGVAAKAVMFDNQEAAQAFFDKVQNVKVDFEKAVKNAGFDIKDFGLVTRESFNVEGPIRTKIVSLKAFPAVELIKVGDKKFAVIKAFSKKETEYVPFEQVKAGIENALKQQKQAEVITKELEKLKKQYNITINEDYFERQAKAREEEAKKAAQAMQQKMPQKSSQQAQAKKPAPAVKGA